MKKPLSQFLGDLARTYAPTWMRTFARKLRKRIKPPPYVAYEIPPASEQQRADPAYVARLEAERRTFDNDEFVHQLPQIFHYWSNKYLRPMFEAYGFSHPDDFFQLYLRKSAERIGTEAPKFLSIGAGNCDTEVRVALLMKAAGLKNFTIECLELSPPMLARGRVDAAENGVLAHLIFTQADFNRWQPSHLYDGVMANQSLHHVLSLEHLFDAVKAGLRSKAFFITSDIIGRNGHMRWPQALTTVQQFWQELPKSHRYNLQLRRQENQFQDWDCSTEGFEGIRAQDVLPELIKRFEFELFIPFGNVIDVFIDRSFGHHLDPSKSSDREFIDRLHAFDEQAFANKTLTPTHLVAVMALEKPANAKYSRGLQPKDCVRN